MGVQESVLIFQILSPGSREAWLPMGPVRATAPENSLLLLDHSIVGAVTVTTWA